MLASSRSNGELLGGEALADPASARLYRWEAAEPLATDGPYSEAKEHLAGFFLIDVESRERAEELAAQVRRPRRHGRAAAHDAARRRRPVIPRELEDVWRRESPHVLGALLRRHGDLGDCEDAAQEALEAAARQWARDGMPDDPRGWLIRVAPGG